MEKPQSIWRFLLEVVVLAGFVLILYGVFEFFSDRFRPTPQSEATNATSYPPPESSIEAEVEVDGSPYPPPYPPPGDQAPPPGIVQDLYSKSSLFAGAKAATLAQGNIWLVESDHQPVTLVHFGDVSVIFGWSVNGSKLLYGRGLFPTYGELSDGTELWYYDNTNGENYPLVDSQKIWSASWSPVDDRVAYCEYGYSLTIISLNGTVLGQQENVTCDFTWSLDGSGIALTYSNPDMVLSDGLRTTALAVWWLEKGELQLLSNAKFNADSHPIWSIDMQRILFHRSFTELSKDAEINGLYVVDIKDGKTTYLSEGPVFYPDDLSRSPRSDTLVFRIGKEIYLMEFDGKPVFIGEGKSPNWLSATNTIIYMSLKGELTSYLVNTSLVGKAVGGGQYSFHVHVPPDYIFFQEAQ